MIVKHTNPCGVASRNDLLEAYRLAVIADPISAFGGIVAFNRWVKGGLGAASVSCHASQRHMHPIALLPHALPAALPGGDETLDLSILRTVPPGSLRNAINNPLRSPEPTRCTAACCGLHLPCRTLLDASPCWVASTVTRAPHCTAAACPACCTARR